MIRHQETDRRKKAFLYTLMICGVLLLMFFLISWKNQPPPPPPLEQLIEVNLGNMDEGLGTIQPLIKGERGPSKDNIADQPTAANRADATDKVTPDDNAEDDAAAVNRPDKTPSKIKSDNVPVPVTPKPQKPKMAYDGPGKGTGNNNTEDNGYKYQGNKPGGSGDAGDPNGNKDSYGNSPGGKIGGGPLVRGNRKIIRHYAFTGDLRKATIYARVRVSPAGVGTFVSFDKGSTSRAAEYSQAISNYLRNIQFDRSSKEDIVQVQFNFNEN